MIRDRGLGAPADLRCRRRARDVALVMDIAFELPAHHARALEYGARGYVSKRAPVNEIRSAIRRAVDGLNSRNELVTLAAREGWLSSSGGPTSTGTDPRARLS